MKIRKYQGMTLIGFLMVLSLTIFTAYLAMRIVPIYLEYYSVVSAMNGIASERGTAQMTPKEIKIKMLNRLYVSYTSGESIAEENIRVFRRNGVQLRVAYQVQKPIMGNLSVLATFDRQVRLAN